MEVNEIQQKIEEGSTQVQQMVSDIIGDLTLELDNYIASVRTLFLSDKDLLDGDLDKILLKIPTYLYTLNEIIQRIEVQKGLSTESAKYYENEALLQATGTVAEKQAKALNNTIQNRIVQMAYKSASSLLQAKMNGAMEILSSAKRVQQRKLEEMKLTKMAGNAVGAF